MGIIGAVAQFVGEHIVPILIFCGITAGFWLAFKLAAGKGGSKAGPAAEGDIWTPIESPSRGSRKSPRYGETVPAAESSQSADGDDFWIAAGGNGTVRSRELGDLLYLGRGLRAVSQDATEPALINPNLPVAGGFQGCAIRRLSYWSSYTEATPEARASYLHWLQTGRSDPGADIGYVFLYFYGLERRALHDARTSSKAAGEVPRIVGEVERLLRIYGSQRSFRGYASAFLDFIAASSLAPYSYTKTPVERGSELTLAHRLALAQCAADQAPLPADWAHFWVTHDRSVSLGTVPRRCPDEFRKMFGVVYAERYGAGLTLPKNRTMLRLEYRPASRSLLGRQENLTVEAGLPDVSVLSSPVRKLAEVAEQACERLGRYSRIIGKDPGAAGSFEALVELPVMLWPEEYRKQLEGVRDIVARAERPAAVPFEKFRSWVPAFAELTRAKVRSLYVALSGVGLGMEPDVRFGGVVPESDSRVVLFADDPETAAEEASPKYMVASLTLHLAAAVAAADGEVAEAERVLLMKQMEEFLSLTESERRRLHAHLRLLLLEPPKLTGLKKRIESLDSASREVVADFLAFVAQADAQVTPDEIRQLQKIFRLLGLEPEDVFSRVHAAATEPVSMPDAGTTEDNRAGYAIPPRPVEKAAERSRGLGGKRKSDSGGRGPDTSELASDAGKAGSRLRLNAAKIAALQKDSDRVAAILAAVFDAPTESLGKSEAEAANGAGGGSVNGTGRATGGSGATDAGDEGGPSNEVPDETLLGLDAVHSSLLETLLSRTHWARAELEELADDRELMLDGALEKLSDACFEKFDIPLFEGSDPLELNPDAVREVLGVEHQES